MVCDHASRWIALVKRLTRTQTWGVASSFFQANVVDGDVAAVAVAAHGGERHTGRLQREEAELLVQCQLRLGRRTETKN